MRYEEKHVDEESQQGDEKGWKEQNEESQEIAGRVRGRMKMCSSCKTEAYEVKECSDRVNDQESWKRMSGARGEAEIWVDISVEQFVCPRVSVILQAVNMSGHTSRVANADTRAAFRTTVPKNAEIHVSKFCDWDSLDNRSRDHRKKEENERNKEQNGQWCCRSKHDGQESLRISWRIPDSRMEE
jgi:hypothetical protein